MEGRFLLFIFGNKGDAEDLLAGLPLTKQNLTVSFLATFEGPGSRTNEPQRLTPRARKMRCMNPLALGSNK